MRVSSDISRLRDGSEVSGATVWVNKLPLETTMMPIAPTT